MTKKPTFKFIERAKKKSKRSEKEGTTLDILTSSESERKTTIQISNDKFPKTIAEYDPHPYMNYGGRFIGDKSSLDDNFIGSFFNYDSVAVSYASQFSFGGGRGNDLVHTKKIKNRPFDGIIGFVPNKGFIGQSGDDVILHEGGGKLNVNLGDGQDLVAFLDPNTSLSDEVIHTVSLGLMDYDSDTVVIYPKTMPKNSYVDITLFDYKDKLVMGGIKKKDLKHLTKKENKFIYWKDQKIASINANLMGDTSYLQTVNGEYLFSQTDYKSGTDPTAPPYLESLPGIDLS